MRLDKFVIPFVFIAYGVLTLKGFHIPRIGSDDGWSWIFGGFFFIVFAIVLDYYERRWLASKEGQEYKENIKKSKITILDYFCYTFFWFGVAYLVLYLFEIHRNDFVFMFFMLGNVFCGKSILKFR